MCFSKKGDGIFRPLFKGDAVLDRTQQFMLKNKTFNTLSKQNDPVATITQLRHQ
jgi:hypothetical protein